VACIVLLICLDSLQETKALSTPELGPFPLDGLLGRRGIYAERAAGWVFAVSPEKHSAAMRNMFAGGAAHQNWALKFPAGLCRRGPGKGSNENSPGAGLAAPGIPADE
jgi:hypothetical protein